MIVNGASILPDFLLPAFATVPRGKPFSCSAKCTSRIGGAAISLPPEVDLRILAPPAPKKKTLVRVEPLRTVEVEGPLGMPYDPSYL